MLVVTKDNLQKSNSQYAQGGIASVLDPEDRFEDHIADTLTAGGKLCDPAVVEMVVREAPERIRELIGWGTQFDVEAGDRSPSAAKGATATTGSCMPWETPPARKSCGP